MSKVLPTASIVLSLLYFLLSIRMAIVNNRVLAIAFLLGGCVWIFNTFIWRQIAEDEKHD